MNRRIINNRAPRHARPEDKVAASAKFRNVGSNVLEALHARPEVTPELTKLPYGLFESSAVYSEGAQPTELKGWTLTQFDMSDPRATAREVRRATGLDLGPMVRMIDLPPLPGSKEPSGDDRPRRDSARRIYLFDISQRSLADQRSGQAPELLGLSLEDIERLQQASATTRGKSLDDTSIEALGVHGIRIKAGGDEVILGRDHHMPIAQDGASTSSRAGMPGVYGRVGRENTQIGMSLEGVVTVWNLDIGGTTVSTGGIEAPLVLAPFAESGPVDAWPSAPIVAVSNELAYDDRVSGGAQNSQFPAYIPAQRRGETDLAPEAVDPWMPNHNTDSHHPIHTY